MSDPSDGVKDLLVAAGVGIFSAITGWGIYISKEPTTPDTVITIYDTGGRPSNPKWLLDYPNVQVRVRGSKGGYQAAYIKMKAVKDALLGLPSQTVGGDQWVAVNEIGGIILLHYDENDRPILVSNYELIIEPAAGTHRTAL